MISKRLATGLKLAAALAALCLQAPVAQAQLSNGVWHNTPQSSGGARAGVEAHPATSATAANPTVFSQPVAVSLVPVVLMSDGSVFANFGFGFERVVRPCSASLVVGQPTVVASNGVVLSQPQQPTYTQPVPNQQSPSQLMVNGSQQTSLSVPAQRACFNRDMSGRVFVYQP